MAPIATSPVAQSTTKDPSHIDLLIVGAGPAGLMTALWASRLGLHARIIDKRGTKVFNGQADGLQCRTLEIFDSFDFGHRAWQESNHMLEINLWNPDPDAGTGIVRSDKIPDTIPGISHWQQVVLHQGRIERFYLDKIAEYSSGKLEVERGVLPETLHFDESKADDDDAYPIRVRLRHLSEAEATPKQTATSANGAGMQDGLFRSNLTADDTNDLLAAARLSDKAGHTEEIHAKYMVGCDGAHSWTRTQLGFPLRGESTDYIWGVLDVIPITDFPDIRMRCAIHSASSGSLMVIPRENKLVRLYIQLTTTDGSGGGKVDRSKINPEIILKSAQRILWPYRLTYRYCDWWTAYQIGQRVGDDFSLRERIFLAGDAVHTHSPKAGQGMNVSMQDTYNLGWKIGAVVNGYCDRKLLKTYQSERRRVAQDLIDFDHKFSRLFSGRPAKDVMDEEGISLQEFKEAFEKGNMFASGIAVDYGASLIVAKEGSTAAQGDGTDVAPNTSSKPAHSDASLATNIHLGKRMPSLKILNQSDARPYHLHELLKSNGHWRILFFPGDIHDPSTRSRLNALGEKLNAADGFIRRFTRPDQAIDSLIECRIIHASARKQTTIFDFPPIFRPFSPTEGWDYGKILVDDESYHEGHGEAYHNYGIGREQGCAVVVRPDQYVSWVGRWDDVEMMGRFFGGFMRESKGGPNRVDVDMGPTTLAYELEEGRAGKADGVAGDAAVEGLIEGAM